MNANNRNRLAITVAALLLSSPAWAQSETRSVRRPGRARHGDAERARTHAARVNKGATEQTEQMEHSTPPPSPPQSQGAEHAASHSSIVQRDLWTRLDTNGDGKISTAEGAVDTEFNAGFGTLDADKDGFVTDTEYRTAAKTEHGDRFRHGRHERILAAIDVGHARCDVASRRQCRRFDQPQRKRRATRPSSPTSRASMPTAMAWYPVPNTTPG